MSLMVIQIKAKSLWENLREHEGSEEMSGAQETLKASHGCLEQFTWCARFHVCVTRESASVDTTVASNFPEELKEIIGEGG